MLTPPLIRPEHVRPLRRAEYDQLVSLGCFANEKVELLDGMLVPMSPQGSMHAHIVRLLTAIFVPGIGKRALVQIQSPFAAADDAEPEPDLAVVPIGDYFASHPTQAFLVVEVAETSLRQDRLLKGALYARSGVPEYWIVNVPARSIEVYGTPVDGAYTNMTTFTGSEVVRSTAHADVAIVVADLFPAS